MFPNCSCLSLARCSCRMDLQLAKTHPLVSMSPLLLSQRSLFFQENDDPSHLSAEKKCSSACSRCKQTTPNWCSWVCCNFSENTFEQNLLISLVLHCDNSVCPSKVSKTGTWTAHSSFVSCSCSCQIVFLLVTEMIYFYCLFGVTTFIYAISLML